MKLRANGTIFIIYDRPDTSAITVTREQHICAYGRGYAEQAGQEQQDYKSGMIMVR
jgi:hypothetical protein